MSTGHVALIASVRVPDGQSEWHQQLVDLGFVAGEAVQVLRRFAPGGDPLVVRVGDSTYALRRAEAACVILRPGLQRA
jgi:ferrous iron transport protein A